jgi:hypothetical protein
MHMGYLKAPCEGILDGLIGLTVDLHNGGDVQLIVVSSASSHTFFKAGWQVRAEAVAKEH